MVEEDDPMFSMIQFVGFFFCGVVLSKWVGGFWSRWCGGVVSEINST